MNKRAFDIVETQMRDLSVTLVDSDDVVTGLLAETNTNGVGFDTYEVHEAYFKKGHKGVILFKATISLSGDQNLDQPFAGNLFEVGVSGKIELNSEGWTLNNYRVKYWKTNASSHTIEFP